MSELHEYFSLMTRQDTYKITRVEFEMFRILHEKLLHTIEPLQKNRTPFIGVFIAWVAPASVGKLVTEI